MILEYNVLRAAMVFTFWSFGYTKWHQYGAQTMIPFISNSPFIFWLYPAFGLRGGARFLGASEWTIFALLFAGFWDKRLRILTAPLDRRSLFLRPSRLFHSCQMDGIRSPGFPAMAGEVPFLMKDLVFLAVSIYLLKQDLLRVFLPAGCRSCLVQSGHQRLHRRDRMQSPRRGGYRKCNRLNRRKLLGSSASALLLSPQIARAAVVKGGLPWHPGAADPPPVVSPGGWHFFTSQEAKFGRAFVNRLIPPDPQTPGGKDCGCAIFIDRQLAGPYGRNESYYMMGPFQQGTKQQGPQSALTIAQQYRKALAALDEACLSKFGKSFADLSDDEKDATIKGLEDASFKLDGFDGKSFFTQILTDTRNGFFPIDFLRRQQGFGRLEDDRVPRNALRLS